MSLHFGYGVWNHVHQRAHGSGIRCFLVAPYCPLLVLYKFTCARGEAWNRSHSFKNSKSSLILRKCSINTFNNTTFLYSTDFVTYCFKEADTADSSLRDHPSFFWGLCPSWKKFWVEKEKIDAKTTFRTRSKVGTKTMTWKSQRTLPVLAQWAITHFFYTGARPSSFGAYMYDVIQAFIILSET